MTDLLGFGKFKIGDDYTKYIEWEDHKGERQRTGDFNEYIIMQSTGLKDKNGTEVFEGDILVGGHVIAWSRGRLIAHYTDSSGGLSDEHEQDLCYETVEIIGNIYKNPELLTSKENE